MLDKHRAFFGFCLGVGGHPRGKPLRDESLGDGFGLNGGEDNVAGVDDHNGSGASAVGGVDELSAIARL